MKQVFSIGCVPYVNALPLIWLLREREDVEIRFDVPSKLPSLLEGGIVQAILVSSYDAVTKPGRQAVDGVCIGSRHEVESVRLFSKVPFEAIGTLALDASSMTSNALAKTMLSEQFGTAPNCAQQPPDLERMLEGCDACVLIGDKGMQAKADGLRVMDLGAAWKDATGLPFVWALWVGTSIPDELAAILVEAPRQLSVADYDEIANEAALRTGMSTARMRRYLSETIAYELDAELSQGLDRFAQKVRDIERVETFAPLWVRAGVVAESR